MTLAKPKEHMLSKKLRRIAGNLPAIDAANFRHLAASLDQTISVLGIWKDPARIKMTNAYRMAENTYEHYIRDHPGAA